MKKELYLVTIVFDRELQCVNSCPTYEDAVAFANGILLSETDDSYARNIIREAANGMEDDEYHPAIAAENDACCWSNSRGDWDAHITKISIDTETGSVRSDDAFSEQQQKDLADAWNAFLKEGSD